MTSKANIQAALVKHEGGGDVNVTIVGNLVIGAEHGIEIIPNKNTSGSHTESDGCESKKKYSDEKGPLFENEKSKNSTALDCQKHEKILQLCKVINKNTLVKTTDNITEHFKNGRLAEPEVKVYPQMRKVTDFFTGSYEQWEEREIKTMKRKFFRKRKEKVIKNQMRREMGFHYRDQTGDEPITVDELVESVTNTSTLTSGEKSPVTAVVASAGSGKTILLRRIARKCVNSCDIEEPQCQAQEGSKKMVHYIELKNVKYHQNLKPSKFLFGGFYENEAEEVEAYKWLLDNQSEVVLCFDGFDQATWGIDSSSQRNIHSFEEATTTEIMYNLLSRNLLPHVKILIASREFKISELPADARPDDIISLVGLQKDDAEELFTSLLGDRGADIWENIRKMSPRLLNLLSIPVFLVLTATVMARDPNNPPPTTITELYNRILVSLRRVETVREREQIMQVIKKLKAMAHQGMMEGRVVFYHSDMEKYGLSIHDVKDLMIKIPGNNLLSRYLLEGDFIFFFCHQSFQEFLSASFVAEMNYRRFAEFNGKHLHESRWSIVRSFVSGIIHNESPSELHEVSDNKRKQKVFCRSLRAQIKQKKNGLESLAAIYESKNVELILSLPHMPQLRDRVLGPDEAHVFGTILAKRVAIQEEEIDLRRCGLTDDLVDVMMQNLKDYKFEVDELNLRFNSFTGKGFNNVLRHLKANLTWIDYTRLKAFRYEDLEWENVREINWYPGCLTVNEKNVIKIEGFLNGCFTKASPSSNRHLRLWDGSENHIKHVSFLTRFFNPTPTTITFENQMYCEISRLNEMNLLDMEGKISKILLDMRFETEVKSSSIECYLRKFQVSYLDVIVNEQTSPDITKFFNDTGCHMGIPANVHWGFKITGSTDVMHLIETVRQNEVETARLYMHDDASPDSLVTFVQNSEVKNLSIVYWDEAAYLRMSHDYVVEIAGPRSITVTCVVLEVAAKGTAWWTADFVRR